MSTSARALPAQAAQRLSQLRPNSIPSRTLPNVGVTSALSLRDVNRLPLQQRPRHLLIQVPNTVLPSDVLRALKEVRAVDDRFSRGNLTPYPLGAIRKSGLMMQYHVTARTPTVAQDMHRLLSTRPLFAASSVGVGPAPARPVLGFEGTRELAAVGFCVAPAREWAETLIKRAARTGDRRGGVEWDHIDVDWAINPALSGRRVLLRGLPGKETHEAVRGLVGDYCEDDRGAVRRLPPQMWSSISCWAITCPSVVLAHDLARRLNMNFFLETQHGSKFPLRAHVVW